MATIEEAKQNAFNAWKRTLGYIRSFKKGRDFGFGETPDTLWAKLPKDSKEFWIHRKPRSYG